VVLGELPEYCEHRERDALLVRSVVVLVTQQ
jgi:hypothetical protein